MNQRSPATSLPIAPCIVPGDTVAFRGYLRDADYGRFRLPSTTQVQIIAELQGYYDGEQEPFRYETTLELDENGGFDSQFELTGRCTSGYVWHPGHRK